MSLKLYAHPFSSYCQKVLIALYENNIPFEFCMLAPDNPQAIEEHEALWPLKRMPVLVDEGNSVVEASIIIEHLGLYHPEHISLKISHALVRQAETTAYMASPRLPLARRKVAQANVVGTCKRLRTYHQFDEPSRRKTRRVQQRNRRG